MREHSGRIEISKFSGSARGFRITIEDVASGCRVIDVTMSIEDFGAAINSSADCTFRMFDAPIGRTREVKTEEVVFDGQDKDAALAPHEVDGWKGRDSDLGNYHRRIKPGLYTVTFVRFIEERGEEKA